MECSRRHRFRASEAKRPACLRALFSFFSFLAIRSAIVLFLKFVSAKSEESSLVSSGTSAIPREGFAMLSSSMKSATTAAKVLDGRFRLLLDTRLSFSLDVSSSSPDLSIDSTTSSSTADFAGPLITVFFPVVLFFTCDTCLSTLRMVPSFTPGTELRVARSSSCTS